MQLQPPKHNEEERKMTTTNPSLAQFQQQLSLFELQVESSPYVSSSEGEQWQSTYNDMSRRLIDLSPQMGTSDLEATIGRMNGIYQSIQTKSSGWRSRLAGVSVGQTAKALGSALLTGVSYYYGGFWSAAATLGTCGIANHVLQNKVSSPVQASVAQPATVVSDAPVTVSSAPISTVVATTQPQTAEEYIAELVQRYRSQGMNEEAANEAAFAEIATLLASIDAPATTTAPITTTAPATTAVTAVQQPPARQDVRNTIRAYYQQFTVAGHNYQLDQYNYCDIQESLRAPIPSGQSACTSMTLSLMSYLLQNGIFDANEGLRNSYRLDAILARGARLDGHVKGILGGDAGYSVDEVMDNRPMGALDNLEPDHLGVERVELQTNAFDFNVWQLQEAITNIRQRHPHEPIAIPMTRTGHTIGLFIDQDRHGIKGIYAFESRSHFDDGVLPGVDQSPAGAIFEPLGRDIRVAARRMAEHLPAVVLPPNVITGHILHDQANQNVIQMYPMTCRRA